MNDARAALAQVLPAHGVSVAEADRRAVFEELNGYAEIPICEEVEFNGRLKEKGKIAVLDEVLLSSDRKLLREGPIWAFIKNAIIKLAFSLGVSPETLDRYY